MAQNREVHLVGSIPLPDTASVFRTLCDTLGPHLRRIPDGETGTRHRWIYWQRDMLMAHPDMELDPDAPGLPLTQWDGQLLRTTELIRFRPGVDPDKVQFHTGYAEAAKDSYQTFCSLRKEGVIPSGVRFQVSLPTAMASGYMYIAPASLPAYLSVYERALLAALNDILQHIPHEDLCIQWDICQEVLIFEDYFPNRPADYKEQIFNELHRLGAAVPKAVELGYHFCYGTPRDEHLVMPEDLAIAVEIANGLFTNAPRPITFIHLPVPKDRTDSAYYAPLQQLQIQAETKLYLGLIHFNDAEGDRARMQTASAFASDFGIASECGWGRTDPDRLPNLLAAHQQAAVAE